MLIKYLWVNCRLLRFATNDGTVNERLLGVASPSFIPVLQNTVIAIRQLAEKQSARQIEYSIKSANS